jgi:prepilin-type N-terminal cleavage/methylation domain-containing protein
MRSASIGIPVGSRSCRDRVKSRQGFTLLEALVALGLILIFAATLGPYLSQARRLAIGAGSRVAAHALLRALLETPVDRRNVVAASRDGETGGLTWTMRVDPIAIDTGVADTQRRTARDAAANWSAFRLAATVSWAPGHSVQAETVRLFKAE